MFSKSPVKLNPFKPKLKSINLGGGLRIVISKALFILVKGDITDRDTFGEKKRRELGIRRRETVR
jgi:hypothetical protein